MTYGNKGMANTLSGWQCTADDHPCVGIKRNPIEEWRPAFGVSEVYRYLVELLVKPDDSPFQKVDNPERPWTRGKDLLYGLWEHLVERALA